MRCESNKNTLCKNIKITSIKTFKKPNIEKSNKNSNQNGRTI